MLFQYQIAPFFKDLIPESILGWDINETKSTCHSCAMARPHYRGKYPYREDLKCCTFHPFIPNFLAGAILEDKTFMEGADVIKKMIHANENALPIGLIAPVDYQIDFNKRKQGEFGQKQQWLCPYYNQSSNRCNIWKYRGVVCTTFFCKPVHRTRGKIFWKTLSDYLSYVEMALMEECLVNLDFSPRQVSQMTQYLNVKNKKNGDFSISKKEIWNGYENYEEFYIKCFHIVKKMDRNAFKELLGDLGKQLQLNVEKVYLDL